ncbi:MAG: glutathione S-transferase family protein [Betaproteobacteria bacterium]|jgi:glutathione S-transferase|nr:glutathione S-transferase family protein [Betaproteobacteria bacterium]NBY16743.1 glutathione S-transferase family protein [Betaproteobacteria bacterium]
MKPMEVNAEPLTLFGAPVGMWTGKIRSYLRKQGIPYVERFPSDPVFEREVIPAVKRFINPVIRLADGTLVQDTADIIDHFETTGNIRFSVYPETPLQRIVAMALDLYGGEGLVRAAMHYRWSYRAQNESFLRHEFGLSYRAAAMPQAQIDAQLDLFMGYLNAYLPKFGINPTTQPAIEAAYESLLSALDAHFRKVPYLLGGLPTLADFGFIANFYAHLGRDPYPAQQMKLSAPSVYRWTERMMASDADMPEFPQATQVLLPEDAIPETLGPVLQCMAADYLPELRMMVRCTDEWLAKQPPIDSGAPVTSKPSARVLTRGRFVLRGAELESMVAPYTLTRLQRVTDTYASLSEVEQRRVADYFSSHGLAELLTLKAQRRVERKDYLEVWG